MSKKFPLNLKWNNGRVFENRQEKNFKKLYHLKLKSHLKRSEESKQKLNKWGTKTHANPAKLKQKPERSPRAVAKVIN